jgi:hypothetical protein
MSFNSANPPSRTIALGSTQSLRDMSTGHISADTKSDNLTAFWEPRRLTTLSASAACYKVRFASILVSTHILTPIVYCLLSIAYCLLPIAYWLFPVPCCLLPVSYCLFPVPCSLLPIACCLLPVACCLLPIACCLLPVPCSLQYQSRQLTVVCI